MLGRRRGRRSSIAPMFIWRPIFFPGGRLCVKPDETNRVVREPACYHVSDHQGQPNTRLFVAR